MPVVTSAREVSIDEALRHPFVAIWPTVERVVDRFSKAIGAPISVYLGSERLYGPDSATYPRYCQALLGDPEFQERCEQDRKARIVDGRGAAARETQRCHAGMRIERRSFQVEGLGVFTILFAGIQSSDVESVEVQRLFVAQVAANDIRLGRILGESLGQVPTLPEEADLALLDALSDTIHSLLNATVGFQALAINMAHEISLMLTGLGSLTRAMAHTASVQDTIDQSSSQLNATARQIHSECRLGLYVARNFLSHASDQRYAGVVSRQRDWVDLKSLVIEFSELYTALARFGDLLFDLEEIGDLPKVYGFEMELRRLLHNVFSNAVKYSFRSSEARQRTVKVWSKVPYDPDGRRFSLTIENYGLGLSKREEALAFQPGFRGEQARREQPNGVGIGLSEVQKIMRMHDGFARIRSRLLHADPVAQSKYLTWIELVFPLSNR